MDFDQFNVHPVLRRQAANLLGYACIFLMEWDGSERIPTGAKLGDKIIVWTQDGRVECVEPDYVLQVPLTPIGGHIGILARSDAKLTGSYERLVDYVIGKPASEQKQVMIIGTNERFATNPDGSPCRQVKSEVAAWLGYSKLLTAGEDLSIGPT